MSGFKKDNHYVPQAYLRQWMINGKVLTYRLLVPHEKSAVWKPYAPKSVAMLPHLYTYFSGAKDSDEIEQWLDREFEAPGFASIAKVVKEARLTKEDWNHLFRFAVVQSIRTPAHMQSFLKRQDETLGAFMIESMEASLANYSAALTAGARPKPVPLSGLHSKLPFKLRRFKNADGEEYLEGQILSGRKLWLWQIEHILQSTIDRIPSHKWTILHAPPGVTWPTTDNPFTRLGVGQNGKWSFEGGWGVQRTRLFMPLSPKHLLFACAGFRPPRRGTVLSLAEAAFYKMMILTGASRYVFSTDTHDIEDARPRTVSREMFEEESRLWADWHETQSKEEALYPDH
ncbi:DUF4238 domain-containing protein [Pseudomonas viridiflava]|uniref:DUF4238 domain-containing protein n=1 Tax=Pseudomonas viridiflava TaxID=33069 RepID=UPI000F0163F6|nr:DUF4238 domain-containing protein [Pseudomonas viridiflava]